MLQNTWTQWLSLFVDALLANCEEFQFQLFTSLWLYVEIVDIPVQ